MKSLKTSTTTQNVAAGVTGSAVVSVGTVALVRSLLPDEYKWDPGLDEAIAAALTAVLTPFLSRWIAFSRDPLKKETAK